MYVWKVIVRVGFIVTGSLLLNGAVLAQTVDLTWNAIGGGGGASGSGVIGLIGTVGQSDAGAMSGGSIRIVGGFWAGAGVGGLCPGDVNGDNRVDLSDLSLLLSNYGLLSGATRGQGDLTGDGRVDLSDLSAVLSQYGNAC